MRKMLLLVYLLLIQIMLLGQENTSKNYWKVTDRNSIIWDLTEEKRLPHQENIEMAGKNIAAILYYEIDEKRRLTLKRDVIFPQLRTFNKTNEPDWKKYRAYFRKMISDEVTPYIHLNNKVIIPSEVDSIEIGGWIKFYHTPVEGLQIVRTLYPSMENRFLVEQWTIKNLTSKATSISITNCHYEQKQLGYKGEYGIQVYSAAAESMNIKSGETYTFPVYYGATLNNEKASDFNFKRAENERLSFLKRIKEQLVLKTPNKVINTLFYFSKIRASESIFNSSMGLVHSPGGGNYYVGIWANDQVEYSGPFFPYLGYENGNIAAYNTYKHFQKNIPDSSHIAYAFEVDGNFEMNYLDRGDAAMIAYGTSHFLLASGDKQMAKELWKLVEWSLEYCHNNRNEFGAVASESDEMEGRIETGKANLSTSSLYYGGLKYSIRLAKALNKPIEAKRYEKRLLDMEKVINEYFGATMEGLETYKYFQENKYLRHWICLPLSMGITDRKEGTLEALFDKLWTDNGILVELKNDVNAKTMFWDRATLYALQGAMKIGATDRAFDKLNSFSRKRLLGDHVPYVVEAYPENNMKHLSAESALYCRIITEGLLGIEPLNFNEFKLKPALPKDWDSLELKNLALGNQQTDIFLERKNNLIEVRIVSDGKEIYNKMVKENDFVKVRL